VTKISRILAVPAVGAYYYEDLAALQANPIPLPERYTAAPVTPGFRHVREVAEAVSVGLVLDGERVAWGDCVAVAYSGKAGRHAIFRADRGLTSIRDTVSPLLKNRGLTGFRELAAEVDGLTETVTFKKPIEEPKAEPQARQLSRRDLFTRPFHALQGGEDPKGFQESPEEETISEERPMHTAVRYGVSQALLKAVAMERGLTMAEVIVDEWELPQPSTPIPIHAQSGGERHKNADKMIARRVASLPHALVDDIPRQLGEDGVELIRYVRWLTGRIRELGRAEYRPTIHLDVHGALGQISENLGRVLGHLQTLEKAAKPYPLRVESAVIMESRAAQIEALKALREYIQFHDMKVQLVADEWANTLEDIQAFVDAQAVDMIQVKMPDLGSVHNTVDAVLACKDGGVGAFLGGSCCETGLSAKVAVHVALATQPDLIMAKPGMGVDEGVTIVQNEMQRTLAWIRARAA
jgi:methylaspartate ammonia-lyase